MMSTAVGFILLAVLLVIYWFARRGKSSETFLTAPYYGDGYEGSPYALSECKHA